MIVRPLTPAQREGLRRLRRHRCGRCAGTGSVLRGEMRGNRIVSSASRCPRCGGSGESPPLPMPPGWRLGL